MEVEKLLVSEAQHSYMINKNTMALVPYMEEHNKEKEGKKDKIITVVYEKDKKPFTVSESPLKIMQSSCKANVSSYNGRKYLTKYFTKDRHKPSVIVDPYTDVYAFPTHADNQRHNSWIFLRYVTNSQELDRGRTIVLMGDGTEIILPLSRSSFMKQYLKASSLFANTKLYLKRKLEAAEVLDEEEEKTKTFLFLDEYSQRHSSF